MWRRSCDCIGTQRPTESLPSVNQLRASEEAGQRYPSTTHRGHFEPWAYLEMPEEGRAFRMVYPTLLVSGWNRAFLWDVPTARLRATIQDIQMPHVGRASRYSGENHLCRTQRPICDYLRSHAIAGLLKQLPGYFVIPCGWMAKAPYQMDSRITREDQKHSNEANAQTCTQATLLKGQLKRCIVVPPTICSPRLLYRG